MKFSVSPSACGRECSSVVRLHGLDTLRGVAAVLVVLLHTGIPYMVKPFPYLVWPAMDAHPSLAVDAITWCAECFLMPLFFILAGFFSNGLLTSRGHRSFLIGRTRRLLFTQVPAGLVILPPCLAIWTLGWVADGIYIPQNFMNKGIPREFEAELYGVAHLWFMQNLYIYCLVLCGLSYLTSRKTPQSTPSAEPYCQLDRLLMSVWKPLMPAIPAALILFWDTRIVLGFYQGYIPVLSKLVYYSIYFFVGTAMYRHRRDLQLHAQYGKTYLLVASLLFCAVYPMIHEHTTVALTGGRLALLAGLLALFACFTSFGLFAVFLRTVRASHPVTQYLADASFWVYLIHLPFVGMAQIAMARLPIATECKYLLSGITAVALALMTYYVMVRDTWLGEFLNGCQRRPARDQGSASEKTPMPNRASLPTSNAA